LQTKDRKFKANKQFFKGGIVMTEMYMSEHFGAWQVGNDPNQGAVEFKLFFPDRSKDSSQYEDKGGTYGDPQIASIQVVGDFQAKLGQPAWDIGQAPKMQKVAHPKGWVWTYRTPIDLPAGFYEYKYYVTFNSGETRYVGDPCTRYGGSVNQNSAFVIGGSSPADNQIKPLKHGRKHLRDLIVYELMIDDFTDEYRSHRAPSMPFGTNLTTYKRNSASMPSYSSLGQRGLARASVGVTFPINISPLNTAMPMPSMPQQKNSPGSNG
jgi:hypothetical protein